jgi:hypothetical protein
MATALAILFVLGMVGGAASGGYNAATQQASYNQKLCNLQKTMREYQKVANTEVELFTQEYFQWKKKVSDLQDQIQLLHADTLQIKKDFDKNYLFFAIAGIGIMLILIFVFVTKKIILKESAMSK